MTKEDVKLNWMAVAESGSITAIHNLREHYATLEAELETEKKLNAEIKARFVKCNTCTPDMKDKCLMFNENLCEGERCEELVDLMALVDKRDSDDKLSKAKETIDAIREAKDRYDAAKDKTPISAFGAEYRLFCDLERILEEEIE